MIDRKQLSSCLCVTKEQEAFMNDISGRIARKVGTIHFRRAIRFNSIAQHSLTDKKLNNNKEKINFFLWSFAFFCVQWNL